MPRSTSAGPLTATRSPVIVFRAPSLAKANRLLMGLAAFAILVSLAAEARALPSPDVAFYLYVTNRILDGARLYVDLVEVNPPLIFAINMPAVLVARWLHVPDAMVYRVLVAAVLALSLSLSQSSLRRLCSLAGAPPRALVNCVLVFALFLVAGEAFGQREHLMFALVLPYLFAACLWATGLGPPKNALAIGIMAGIGIALKPYFVVFWLAVELWLRVKRPRAPLARRELLAAAATLAAYAIAVWLVTPEYIRLLKLLGPAYSRYMSVSPLTALAIGEGSLVSLVALLAFAAFRRAGLVETTAEGLMVAIVSLLLAAALQRKGWGYHFYPSVAASLVLLGILAARASEAKAALAPRVYRYVIVAALLFVIGSSASRAITAIITPLAERITQYPSYPELQDLVSRKAADKTVMIWSFNIRSAFPLVTAAGARWGSRLPSMWLLPALYWENMPKVRPTRFRPLEARSEAERFLDSTVARDMEAQAPALLIVLRPSREAAANGFERLDYRSYFGTDPRIARALQCYRFAQHVGVHDVYERWSGSDCPAGE